MEEKKFDANSLIGFLLLGAIMLYYMYTNQPQPATPAPTNIPTGSSQNETTAKASTNASKTALFNQTEKDLGSFSYAGSLPVSDTDTSVLENERLRLTFSNKGGQIKEALVKNFSTFEGLPLYMIRDANTVFNLNFGTTSNRVFNTSDLTFQPELTKNGDVSILTMRLKASEDRYLEYRYELEPNSYDLSLSVKSVGLSTLINRSAPVNLSLNTKAFRHEKSQSYENQMTALYYEKEDGKIDDLSISGSDEETESHVDWVGFKQHFFSAIFMTEKPFETANLSSKTLFEDGNPSPFTKGFAMEAPLKLNRGELDEHFRYYIGPNDYDLLASYNHKIENVIELGWGIFGWINRNAFIPLFSFLSGLFSNYGLIIILMTIVVRIFMSPLVYKSYLSSAKMKVLRPEMNEINEKYPGKENAMKRQQEIMALQRKAGVNMMSGCIPALLQMPVFFALFRFFPSALDLRQKGFLWADDLSSYDSVYRLPFNIPLYGDHISLFPILASVAIFFYMQMNQSQQMNMQAPAQEGMPDMQKMMKMMMYLSPVMMLVFFNSYGAGLSLYYFVSNLLTITIMLVIKNFIIDEDKIHAQIEENKKRPEKKKSKFRERMEAAMKEAQEQQKRRK